MGIPIQIRSITMGLRLRFLSLAFFLALPVWAGEDWTPLPVGPMGGLNNRDTSFTIPANQAQDLLNVNITNQGKSVKKRPGYAQAFALAQTTSAVHGTYLFYNSSGNDVVLAFNDTKVTASVSGASATVIYSTATNGATFQCSDYLGFAYCADSSRDALFKTDGASISPILTISSTGTMVAACPTRLAMAGFAGSPARIDLSADTDFTSWGTGSLGTSPVQLTVTAPGSSITHITYAFGRLMWFKQTSFGYVLIGNQPLQTDWVIKTISNTIGTIDNSSTQDFNGNLYFRGSDGHQYVFDGSNVVKISREIPNSLGSIGLRVSNSLSLTSVSDWNSGTFSGNTVYVDTETNSGNIQTTFPDNFSTFRDGTNGTKNVWKIHTSGGTGSVSATGSLSFTTSDFGANFDEIGIRTSSLLPVLQAGTSFQMTINTMTPANPSNNSMFTFLLSTYPITAATWDGQPNKSNIYFTWASSQTGVANFKSVYDGNDSLVSVSTSVRIPFNFTIYVATLSYAYSVNGTLISSSTRTDPNGNMGKPNYAYLIYRNYANSGICIIDDFIVAPASFSYTSSSQAVSSSITSWDSFNVTKNSAGNISFGIRSANSDAYTSIIPGNVPTITARNYWQMISTFSFTDSTQTSPLSLSDVTQNWFEGSASDKAYAAFFDDKVWWSISSGAGQSTNNRVLIYDLLYQGWTLYDLPSNGFYVRNNALYFGSSNGGYIYKYGVGNNDAGAAINAYWKSKDFFGADPFSTQEIANISVVANSAANSSLNVTYTMDGSNATTYAMGLGSGVGFINKNLNLPLGKVCSDFNIKFGNNAADQPFEVFGAQIGIRERPWIPN